MDWEGIATVAYFNALWGCMAYLYAILDIQTFLLCFLGGMVFSLAVAVLVGLYKLNHARTAQARTAQARTAQARTAQTRYNRRLLRAWPPVTVACSAATHVVLLWRNSSPLLHPDLGKAVSASTGNLVLVFAVLVISSACVSVIVLPFLSFFGHLFFSSLHLANLANGWTSHMVEPLDLGSVPIFRPTWDIWTFATKHLAFFLGPWLALRARNAFSVPPASPHLDQIIQLSDRMPASNALDEKDAPRPPDNTFPPPPFSTYATPPRARASNEDDDVI